MIDVEQKLPPRHVEVLVKMTTGNFAVAEYHPEHAEKWWPGSAYFGEYGYEACVKQDVESWQFLPDKA